ncbi:uncharacterized protein LOC121183439 isoform X1 [Toxotes jaculatrix]|uniref:uncharacterized protein LOC121183439 isoform X1 n=1 Tax=Toxotes jaculatrix TaxID=941984 RepID=UPI001B3AE498|nr:uncharacterized protein LOC121183439 isoform X1 [Toxotes jaculatrix]
MVDNTITKSLGLVLIATAHMVFNGPSQAEVIGIIGSNITLHFIFNNTKIDCRSHFVVYMSGYKKIAEYSNNPRCSGGGVDIYPGNSSVQYHITNLTKNHSDIYWASLFMDTGIPPKSIKIKLIVQEENRRSTVPPKPANITNTKYNGSSSFFSYHSVTVLVVSPVVLLVAVLPWLIWCLVRTKDKQQPQQNSNPTGQERVGESSCVSSPSLVYSVLDFPKRPPAVLEHSSNDTEYAAVSYLPENRRV